MWASSHSPVVMRHFNTFHPIINDLMITLTYSVNKYLLTAGDMSLDKTEEILAPVGLAFWWGDTDN